MTILAVLLAGCGEENLAQHDSGRSDNDAAHTGSAAPSGETPGISAAPAASKTASPAPAAFASSPAPAASAASPAPAHSEALLEGGVSQYSGGETQFKMGDEYVPTSFSGAVDEPVGLYMPDTMSRFTVTGGTAWGTADKQNYIAMVKQAADPAKAPPVSGQSADLLKYKEYEGSSKDGTATLDQFTIEVQGQAYDVFIRTGDEQRSAMLPLFLEMLRSSQFLVKLGPLEAGVFLEEPDVGNDPGKLQALQEAMDVIQAIADKDYGKFAATMKSAATADNLRHFVDNQGSYHFYKMTVLGIPFKEERWASFQVDYYWTSPDGYVIDRGFTIAMLPDKQGTWKIADID
ncbi:hypothetical protein [Paenibacillus tengchongensis]|uniref:hypothetical protein n=1 Tax=Paenibacillus tengchongensis TaxID=2608684 RepID=UPI001C9E2ACE|nr:hypothetical protein [Paenibacillus tengchongensis]